MTNRFARRAATNRLTNDSSQLKFAVLKSETHLVIILSLTFFFPAIYSAKTFLRYGIPKFPQHFADFTRQIENAVIVGQFLPLECKTDLCIVLSTYYLCTKRFSLAFSRMKNDFDTFAAFAQF